MNNSFVGKICPYCKTEIKENDEVVRIIFQDEEDMILLTKNGMSIKFATKEINPVGRAAMGVKGIKLSEDDEIVAALPIHKTSDTVAIFTENGLGKKVSLEDFPLQGRGGKGTICSKSSIIKGLMISNEDNILICGNKSSICISAKDIPLLSKISQGNILLKDNKVLSATKI